MQSARAAINPMEVATTEVPQLTTRKKLVFSACTLTLALLGLELFARWWSPMTYDDWRAKFIRYEWKSDRYWQPVPGRYSFGGKPVTICPLGIRGVQPVIPKPERVFRILVLGGSSAFDAWVDNERTWPVRVGEQLSAATGRIVEVVNAGVPGYTLYQSANRFEDELFQLQPDAVLVSHLWNDVKTFSYSGREACLADWVKPDAATTDVTDPYRDRPLLDFFSRHLHLVSKFRLKLIWMAMADQPRGEEGRNPAALQSEFGDWGPEFLAENLRRLLSRCRELQVPVLVLEQPLRIRDGVVPPEIAEVSCRYAGLEPSALVRAIEAGRTAIREAVSASNVILLPTQSSVPATADHFRDHVHLTDAGSAVFAEAVAKQMLAHWPLDQVSVPGE